MALFRFGGIYRRRALQSLAVFGALSLPTVLWVFHVSPNWIQEIRSNMLALSAHGSVSDPSPAFVLGRGTFMITDLQAVISFFWDDPKVYNSLSYVVCLLLLAVWIFVTLRSRPLQNRPWLALAAVSAFSMLPVYHRQYDARLVILTIPACALLWAEGGLVGRLAMLVNCIAFVHRGSSMGFCPKFYSQPSSVHFRAVQADSHPRRLLFRSRSFS